MSWLWTTEDMIAAMAGRPFGTLPEGITGISIDSRSLEPGNAFFAIKGEAMAATAVSPSSKASARCAASTMRRTRWPPSLPASRWA